MEAIFKLLQLYCLIFTCAETVSSELPKLPKVETIAKYKVGDIVIYTLPKGYKNCPNKGKIKKIERTNVGKVAYNVISLEDVDNCPYDMWVFEWRLKRWVK